MDETAKPAKTQQETVLDAVNTILIGSWTGKKQHSGPVKRKMQDALVNALFEKYLPLLAITSDETVPDAEAILRACTGNKKKRKKDNGISCDNVVRDKNGNTLVQVFQKHNLASLTNNHTNHWNQITGDNDRLFSFAPPNQRFPFLFIDVELEQTYKKIASKGKAGLSQGRLGQGKNDYAPYNQAELAQANYDKLVSYYVNEGCDRQTAEKHVEECIAALARRWARAKVYTINARLSDDLINILRAETHTVEEFKQAAAKHHKPIIHVTVPQGLVDFVDTIGAEAAANITATAG